LKGEGKESGCGRQGVREKGERGTGTRGQVGGDEWQGFGRGALGFIFKIMESVPWQ